MRVALLLTFLVLGCEPDLSQAHKEKYYDEICLNGVVYYRAHHRLAPKIEQQTLAFVRCK